MSRQRLPGPVLIALALLSAGLPACGGDDAEDRPAEVAPGVDSEPGETLPAGEDLAAAPDGADAPAADLPQDTPVPGDPGLVHAPDTGAETGAELPAPDLPAPSEVIVDVPSSPDVPAGPVYLPFAATCGDAPPAGVTPAPPFKAPVGKCPVLVADGKTKNLIQTAGGAREFLLVAPKEIKPGEALKVLVAWHWLKGSAKNFVSQGELLEAAEQQRFIAIIPESKGDISVKIPLVKDPISFPWPFVTLVPASRIAEEHAFFDEMVACTAAQLPLNKECVSVVGVSAGALYGALLAAERSDRISSFVSLSGGIKSSQPIANSFLAEWKPPARKLPMLVLWGGPNDSCALLNFQAASQSLEAALDKGGHFLVECVHNCGHGVPPVEPVPGTSKFDSIWAFAWSHPYWLPAGASPWATGLPAGSPSWCAVGSGKAKPKIGACGEPGCPM